MGMLFVRWARTELHGCGCGWEHLIGMDGNYGFDCFLGVWDIRATGTNGQNYGLRQHHVLGSIWVGLLDWKEASGWMDGAVLPPTGSTHRRWT